VDCNYACFVNCSYSPSCPIDIGPTTQFITTPMLAINHVIQSASSNYFSPTAHHLLFHSPRIQTRLQHLLWIGLLSAAHFMLLHLCGTNLANLNSFTRPTLHSCCNQSQVFNWAETHHPAAQVEDHSNLQLFVDAQL